MKKYTKILSLIAVLICIVFMSGCAKNITVEYQIDDTVITTQQYAKNNKIKLAESPTKEGYTFVGWYDKATDTKVEEKVKVKGNLVLVGKYEITNYQIIYQNEGNQVSNPTTYTMFSEDITLNNPTRDGYVFLGWYNGDTKVEKIVKGSMGNLTLVAKWEVVNGHKVVFKAGVGEFSDGTDELVIYVVDGGELVYPENPVVVDKNGRVFKGWYIDSEIILPGTLVTEDLVLRAKYVNSDETYSLIYNLNGGTMEGSTEQIYFKDGFLALETPKKEGFEFLGWYDNESFNGKNYRYIDENSTGNVELFAKWVLVNYEYVDTIFLELIPDEITDDLYMPFNYQGVELAWKSSNTSILSLTGVINQSHQDQEVTIELDITFEDEVFSYSKKVTIKRIVFEDITNPVAGYFYTTGVTIKSETVVNNLDIAYYAFVKVQSNGAVTVEGLSSFNTFVRDGLTLRKKGIRMVLSVAGGADNFSNACRNVGPSAVADNIMYYVEKYNLDGVDIDWEFPADSTDQQYLNVLCQSLRAKLDILGKGGTPYLLTAAIPSSQLYQRFDLKTLNKYLDYVNMMSYDMNASGRASHLCPLFRAFNDGNLGYGIDDGIVKFTTAGLDANKIIVGGAFYGKAYTVKGTGNYESKYPALGAPAELNSLQYASGTVTYKYISKNILTDSSYKRYFDNEAKVPYLYSASKKIFITYEDVESLQLKTEYAYENGMGIMFWEYGYDDNNILTDAICDKMAELKNKK